MSNFYDAIKRKFADLETRGLLIPTTHSKRFPIIDGKLYEPEGKIWFEDRPIYSTEKALYHKNVLKNPKPLSAFPDIPQD